MVWLRDDEKNDDMFSRFDRIPSCDRQMTDRRTDGPPSFDIMVRDGKYACQVVKYQHSAHQLIIKHQY